MAVKVWETLKVQYCDHAKSQVGLLVEVVYPSEILPDQPPRVLAHRCSHDLECNLVDCPSCVWSGTNPYYDPFA